MSVFFFVGFVMADEKDRRRIKRHRELIDETINNLSDAQKIDFYNRRILAWNALVDKNDIPKESIPLYESLRKIQSQLEKSTTWALGILVVLAASFFFHKDVNASIISMLLVGGLYIAVRIDMRFYELRVSLRFNVLKDKLDEANRTLNNLQILSEPEFFDEHRKYLHDLPSFNPYYTNEAFVNKTIEELEVETLPSRQFKNDFDEKILLGMHVIDGSFFWQVTKEIC